MADRIRLAPGFSTQSAPVITLLPGASKTVGRSSQSDIVVDEPSLSRVHARLTSRMDGGIWVEDLGSTNGVQVNGQRKTEAVLKVGDRLQLGLVEYRVELDTPLETSVGRSVDRQPFSVNVSHSVDGAALAGLLATSRELMAFEDLRGLLDRVLDRLQPILRPDRSAILLFDTATDVLTPRATRPAGAYTSVSEFASATVVREAIRARETIEVEDAASDRRVGPADSMARAGVRTALCVPLLGRAGPIGALYADRTVSGGRFTPQQVQIASAFAAHAAAALETAQLYEDREQTFHATLEAFARAIDARDRYTAGHSERVTAYALTLAGVMGASLRERETIRRAGMLHDIGKVGVPDGVLLKPAPLDPDEQILMQAHVVIGCDMLAPLAQLADTLPIIRGHHERWDGRGYPDGIAGTAIHPHARLLAVADSFDAMTSERPYRKALPLDEAVRRIQQGRESQFAADIVDAFAVAEQDFREIRASQAGYNPKRPTGLE